jgi:TonB family protein
MLDMFADPDVAAVGGRPPLSDLRTLAIGFRDLSVRAAADATPVPPVPAQDAGLASLPPHPVSSPSSEANPGAAPRVYGPQDVDVVPPVVVRQTLPPFPLNLVGKGGILEVVIDENGEVEDAIMRTSLNPSYDRSALSAARQWEYKPAMKDGVPVKFRKVVQVVVKR